MLLPTFLLIAGSVVMVTSMCTVGNPRNQKSGNDRILQVCMDGMTYTDVCSSGWSIDEAAVRCRSRDRPAPIPNWENATSSLTTTALSITCLGTEVSLSQCNYTIVADCTRVSRSFCYKCPTVECPVTATCDNKKCYCNNSCQNNGSCHAGVCYCPDTFHGDT